MAFPNLPLPRAVLEIGLLFPGERPWNTAGPQLMEEQPQSERVPLMSLSLTELCKLLPSVSEQ